MIGGSPKMTGVRCLIDVFSREERHTWPGFLPICLIKGGGDGLIKASNTRLLQLLERNICPKG
jgi:hypothetical protein